MKLPKLMLRPPHRQGFIALHPSMFLGCTHRQGLVAFWVVKYNKGQGLIAL